MGPADVCDDALLFPPLPEHLPAAAPLLARMERCAAADFADLCAFEAACADASVLWAALGDGCAPVGQREAALGHWPAFLARAAPVAVADPSRAARPLLCAVAAALPVANESQAAAEAIAQCVGAVAAAAVQNVRQRAETATALVPPLALLRDALRIAELLQEIGLRAGIEAALTAPPRIAEEMAGACARYSRVFVEAIAFPAYWSLPWHTSSPVALVQGVHPAVLSCLSTAVAAVRRWRGGPQLYDDRPCRQLLALLWERSAAAIAHVPEVKELSKVRTRQLVMDTMHFVMFARMFREYIGALLFQRVTVALVKLLSMVARRVESKTKATVVESLVAKFSSDIWEVPPISTREWGLPVSVFTPWNAEFIRGCELRTAQSPPDGWEKIEFDNLS